MKHIIDLTVKTRPDNYNIAIKDRLEKHDITLREKLTTITLTLMNLIARKNISISNAMELVSEMSVIRGRLLYITNKMEMYSNPLAVQANKRFKGSSVMVMSDSDLAVSAIKYIQIHSPMELTQTLHADFGRPRLISEADYMSIGDLDVMKLEDCDYIFS